MNLSVIPDPVTSLNVAFRAVYEANSEVDFNELALAFAAAPSVKAAIQAQGKANRLLNLWVGGDNRAHAHPENCPVFPFGGTYLHDVFVFEHRAYVQGDPTLCGRCIHQLDCALKGGPDMGNDFEAGVTPTPELSA